VSPSRCRTPRAEPGGRTGLRRPDRRLAWLACRRGRGCPSPLLATLLDGLAPRGPSWSPSAASRSAPTGHSADGCPRTPRQMRAVAVASMRRDGGASRRLGYRPSQAARRHRPPRHRPRLPLGNGGRVRARLACRARLPRFARRSRPHAAGAEEAHSPPTPAAVSLPPSRGDRPRAPRVRRPGRARRLRDARRARRRARGTRGRGSRKRADADPLSRRARGAARCAQAPAPLSSPAYDGCDRRRRARARGARPGRLPGPSPDEGRAQLDALRRREGQMR
jgi:hypothetical protein